MESVTLDEFIAEIETTFKNYADTNDIDRVSIKGWVISELRRFGKNICDKRETIVDVKGSRALLPETYKSLIMALKLSPNDMLNEKPEREKKLIVERQRIENPAEWTTTTMDYFVNNCESKIVTEKVYIYGEPKELYYNPQWLDIVQGVKKDTLDVNCLNLHPSIRGNYPNKISITNRTLNTNFREGKVWMMYNSLPSDENGEIVIPIITTGDIEKHVKNEVYIKLATELILGQRSSPGLKELIPLWVQNQRLLFISAKSEATWNRFSKNFDEKLYAKNRLAQAQYNLPK